MMSDRQMRRAVCVSVAICIFACAIAHSQVASEYSIKAGYLLLFTRYVEWPESTFASDDAPIVICVVGADPFGELLDRTVQGQRSQDRPLAVRRVSDSSKVSGCHIAFISGRETASQEHWLAELAGRPILTVTEDPAAFADGAVVSFTPAGRRESRIRFDASIPSMQRAGLRISAEMLVAARKVHREAGA